MALESQHPAVEFGDGSEKSAQKVETLLNTYKDLLQQSSEIFEVDKRHLLELLDTKPVSALRADDLAANINFVPELEKNARQDREAYEKKIDDLNAKGGKTGLELVSLKAKLKYMDWLKQEPYERRQAVLAQPFFKEAERLKLLENFSRLPEAVRKTCAREINALPGLEEKQARVTQLLAEHEELKAAFLALPQEVQQKYRTEFKESELADRRKLLKSIAKVASLPLGMSESAEKQDLENEFREQMVEDGVKQNLFSPLSIEANLMWLTTLPLKKQRIIVNEKKSDLYLRMHERTSARDEFDALPEETRRPLALRFRNADLDVRKEILAGLKHPEAARSKKTSYPEDVVRRVAASTLDEKEFAQDRLIFTELKRSAVLRKRAELSLDAKETDRMREKAEARGMEVDPHTVVYAKDLDHHGEERFHLKNFLKPKQKSDDLAVNMTLLDGNRRAVTADQFQELILKHRQKELTARLHSRMLEKLPNADSRQLAHVLAHVDLTVDLLEVAA